MKPRERTPVIGIFGKRNQGKSSIINALTGQQIAIVSEIPGTTTDPVKKTIEIPAIGPVVLVDTAGIDDIGELGQKRVDKTLEVIKQIDLAMLVIAGNMAGKHEEQIIKFFDEYAVPFFWIHNKSDLEPISPIFKQQLEIQHKRPVVEFSAVNPINLEELVNTIRSTLPETAWKHPSLLGDLVKQGDIVMLITPVDIEAPEGRLILPQVQTIRDLLDNDCVAIVVKEREADAFLRRTGIKPALVITDSSIFPKAAATVPEDIPLTGFSILLARYKGPFEAYLQGTPKLASLKDGDTILILESCSHHVSCDDIGRVKIPRWIDQFTGKKLKYEVVAGLNQLPGPITNYAMVIQCGACMITRKQLINRLKPAIEAGIPVTNYGMAIAFMQGIYQRAIQPFTGTQDGDIYL